MQVRHIASMATGHDRETFLEALTIDPADPIRGFFTIPPDAEPGTLFAYNQPPGDGARRRSCRGWPVSGSSTTCDLACSTRSASASSAGPQRQPGLDMGFSGVYTNLDAIARLGQLHLDDGVHDGRRLLPAGWVADASVVQIANPQREEPDWRQGYGFQLWRSQHGYRGDGAFGQYMVVLPEHDAVVAMFSCTEDMQIVLDLMWAHLLPAMDAPIAPAVARRCRPRRAAGRRCAADRRRRPAGGPPPDVPSMTFLPAATGPAVATHRHEHRRPPAGGWSCTRTTRSIDVPLTTGWTVAGPSLAASAARLADGRLAVDLAFLVNPHRLEIELDPATATFTTHWPNGPLFGAGLDRRLTSMHLPPT